MRAAAKRGKHGILRTIGRTFRMIRRGRDIDIDSRPQLRVRARQGLDARFASGYT
jgi:hypothetical protein